MTTLQNKSYVLKIALFATGLAGIVAEYLLATLATYFLNDSVLQWTMIVSVMLFSMGFGSSLSRYIKKHMLEYLVFIEILLSILTSMSALFVYIIAAHTIYVGFFIYGLSIVIGMLIGMEIPLVTRINERFESLRTNIADVMAMDYVGSLLGGFMFVFIGLPYLGTTYTPFVLGSVNMVVAFWLVIKLRSIINGKTKRFIYIGFVFTAIVLGVGLGYAEPIRQFSEHKKYQDKIILEKQSKFQKIVVTQWKSDYWLYINGNQQLSTLDEYLYHEPLVHPAMALLKNPEDILIIGGGDGCAVKELLKYESVKKITLVDLDPVMTELAKNNPYFLSFNDNALNNEKVTVVNTDGFKYLESAKQFYDLVIVDLPDPNSIEINKLYTVEFYQMAQHVLRPYGLFITQAGSPYYAAKAFNCIKLTMEQSGFNVLPMHNQVLTMGQWGWLLGSTYFPAEELKTAIQNSDITIETVWLNNDALKHITSFGKDVFDAGDVEINTISNPVLYQYYRKGRWELY